MQRQSWIASDRSRSGAGGRSRLLRTAAFVPLVAACVLGIGSAVASAAPNPNTFTVQSPIPVNGALSLVAASAPVGSHTALIAGGNGGVSVLENGGSGSFSAGASLPGAAAPSLPGIGVGDVNGDGYPDIVTLGSILFGQSGGGYVQQSFSLPDLGPGTGSGAVAVGDINGDGIADIAFSIFSYGTGAAAIWLGGPGAPGSWAPAATETYPAGSAPFSVAIGDLNGDGRGDVVVANGSSNSISVFDGAASSPYLVNRQDYATAAGGYPTPDNLALADVNGDGRLDVLAVGRGPGQVSTFLNNGAGGLAPAVVSAVGPLGTWGPTGSSWDARAVAVGDFNGDGKADIVVTIPWDLAAGPFSQVAMLNGDGAGNFGDERDFAVGNGPASAVTGDFNGDGFIDFAIGNTADSTVTVVLNGGPPLPPLDTTPPVLSLPANKLVEATGPGGAVVSFVASAADIVDGTDPVACAPASGSLFPVGTTTVNCSATDAHANTTSGSFKVTVNPPPVLTASLAALSKGGDDESEQSFRVVFSASDPAGLRSVVATLNGVVVTNGQVVKLKLVKKGPQKAKREDGKLQIEATSFLLTVLATDNLDGSRTQTAVPVFVKKGKDGEDKGKGDDGKGKGDH